MSAEPKVLLEWKEPVVTGRIMSDRTVHMAFDDGTSWKLCDDDSVSVLAIYDALEARHARVREVEVARLSALVPRWVPVGERLPGGWVRALLSDGSEIDAQHWRNRGALAPHGEEWRDVQRRFWPSPPDPRYVTHWLEVPIPPLPGTETP